MTVGERAKRAQLLLDDPVLAEAFAQIKQEAVDAIANSRPRQQKKREMAYLQLRSLDSLHNKLRSIVNDAKVEAFKRRS